MCVWEDWIIGVFVENSRENLGIRESGCHFDVEKPYKCSRTAFSSKSSRSKASISLDPSSLDWNAFLLEEYITFSLMEQ